MARATDPHALLVETAQGDTVAVRFPSLEEAREWEDAHTYDLGTVRGCVRLVSRRDALAESREN